MFKILHVFYVSVDVGGIISDRAPLTMLNIK